MDSFSWNKLFAGFLVCLLVIKLSDFFSAHVMEQKPLDKNSYIIDVSSVQSGSDSNTTDVQEIVPDIKPFLVKADIKKGEDVFKKCLQCHSINKGGIHKIGPNIFDVVLKPFAHANDFAYSAALKERHDKDKWTIDNLNAFLFKPKKLIPATKMTFVGIKDDQERADLIAYLRAQSDNPVPLG
ncbi:MAG: cytochrome c family protein [Proteobacteria bacterium]|nr:cytochrome c family protein [Pseudomonadota bacterium]